MSAGPEASPTELFGNRHAVRLMGVPFNVMNEDIVEFFSGIQFSLDIHLKIKQKQKCQHIFCVTTLCVIIALLTTLMLSGINIVPNGIHIQGELGNRTGLCLIEVESNSDVEEALKRDKLFIGPRYVEGIYMLYFLSRNCNY